MICGYSSFPRRWRVILWDFASWYGRIEIGNRPSMCGGYTILPCLRRGKTRALRLSQSRIKYECIFRATGAKDFPLIMEPWIGIRTPIRFGGDSDLLCLWAAQRLKCCAYSLMIFASSASPAFPRRAQTNPRGGNAAHRAAYRPTPALLCRAGRA